MADFEVTSPTGQKFVVTAPEGATQEQVLAYAQSQFKPQEPTGGERAARVAGLGARALATGVPPIGLGLALGEGLNQAYNLATGSNRSGVFQGWNTFLTQAGLPEPQTPAERVSSAITSGMAGMGGQVGLMQQARPAAQSAQELIRQQLVQQPGRQVVAGGTSGAGSSLAAEAGAGPVGQTVAGVVTGMAPFAGQMISKPSPELTRTALISERAMDKGIRLPPTQADPGFTNAALEGWAGGYAPTQRTLSIKNQPKTDMLIKQDFGIPKNQSASVEKLKEIRTQESAVYRDIKSHGRYNWDQQFDQDINSAAAGQMILARESSSLANQDILKVVADLQRGSWQGETLIEMNKALRDKATVAFRKGETGEGRFYSQSAKAVEDLIGRNLEASGKPGMAEKWNAARVKIAQTHSAEAALDDNTGHFDARILGNQLDQGVPLTGNMRIVAQTARAFPSAMRTPQQVGQPAGRDVLGSYMTGGSLAAYGAGASGAYASGNPWMLGLAAFPLMRPAVRSLITSRPYQGILVNPQTQPLSQSTAGILGLAPSLYQ